MRKLLLMLLILIIIISGCCQKGDNACYKAWYGLEPNPMDPNLYTEPWERFLNPELRNPGDPGQPFWDGVFGIKEKNIEKSQKNLDNPK